MRPDLPRLSWNLSACIEWLFADGGRPFPERVRSAAGAGFTAVEFWTARDKNVDHLAIALEETDLAVTAFVAEPTGRLVDPATHDDFLRGVEASCRLARRIRAGALIVVAGDTMAGVDRNEQRQAITEALVRAAPIASESGVKLMLEPLNSRVDHPGYFLDSTAEGLEIIRNVADPSVRLLYDMYHSIVMGEDPAAVLGDWGQLVGHVHIADAPGRHEPGSGTIDWSRELAALRRSGYDGSLGLEYKPARDTESSLVLIRDLAR